MTHLICCLTMLLTLWCAPPPAAGPAPGEPDQLFAVRLGGRYGYINRRGTLVIEPSYAEAASRFSHGLAWVKVDDKVGFIDMKGEMRITPQFNRAGRFSSGRAVVHTGGHFSGRFGYIDTTGEMVIPAQYDSAYLFVGGVAKVGMHSPWDRFVYRSFDAPRPVTYSYIDVDGRVIPDEEARARLAEAQPKSLEPFKSEGRAGFRTPEGEVVISPRFDAARSFSEGRAAVLIGKLWGYIDQAGKVVIEPQFDDAYWFEDGLAKVVIDGARGYIDRDGNMVWAPTE